MSELTREEWLKRYKQAFIDGADLTDSEAQSCVDAISFEDASRQFETDPEGAAQMEMSYWEP